MPVAEVVTKVVLDILDTRFCLLLPPVSLTVTLLEPGFLIESEVVSGSGFPGVF